MGGARASCLPASRDSAAAVVLLATWPGRLEIKLQGFWYPCTMARHKALEALGSAEARLVAFAALVWERLGGR